MVVIFYYMSQTTSLNHVIYIFYIIYISIHLLFSLTWYLRLVHIVHLVSSLLDMLSSLSLSFSNFQVGVFLNMPPSNQMACLVSARTTIHCQ